MYYNYLLQFLKKIEMLFFIQKVKHSYNILYWFVNCVNII